MLNINQEPTPTPGANVS